MLLTNEMLTVFEQHNNIYCILISIFEITDTSNIRKTSKINIFSKYNLYSRLVIKTIFQNVVFQKRITNENYFTTLKKVNLFVSVQIIVITQSRHEDLKIFTQKMIILLKKFNWILVHYFYQFFFVLNAILNNCIQGDISRIIVLAYTVVFITIHNLYGKMFQTKYTYISAKSIYLIDCTKTQLRFCLLFQFRKD